MENGEEIGVVLKPEPPKRLCPTLHNLCLPVAVERIRNLEDNEHSLRAFPILSQKIFDLLHVPHNRLSEELVNYIEQKLKIHSIALGRNNIGERYRQMVYSQPIESLVVLDLKDGGTYVRNGPNAGSKRKGRPDRIHIVGFLRRFLNPESRKILANLTIAGKGLAFQPGWTKEVQQLLPAIKSLDLSGCYVTNEELKTLCESGPMLNSLSISQTEVYCLNGIGMLSNLKTLVLEDLMFKNAEKLEEVLLLHQLETLYLSNTTGGANTVTLFSKCQGTLPNLKFLDCSGNRLNDTTINNLLSQHPKLEKISVMSTIFERHIGPDIFIRKVKLHNIADLASTVDSLKLYMSHPTWCKPIMQNVYDIMTYLDESQTEKDVLDCARSLIGVFQSYHQTLETKGLALRCLKRCNRKRIIEMLAIDERTKLVFVVCSLLRAAEWVIDSVTDDPAYGFAVDAIEFFDETDMQDGTNLEEVLSDILLNRIQRAVGASEKFMVPCSSFLIKHRDSRFYLDRNATFLIKLSLYQVLLVCWERRVDACEKILKFLVHLFWSNDDDKIFNEALANTIFKVLNRYRNEPVIAEYGFFCLMLLYQNFDQIERDKVFEEDKFGVITNCLMTYDPRVQKATVRFLMEQHKKDVEQENYSPHTVVGLEPTLSETVRMIEAYGQYKKQFVTVLFAHIAITAVVEEVAAFGDWVVGHFPEFRLTP